MKIRTYLLVFLIPLGGMCNESVLASSTNTKTEEVPFEDYVRELNSRVSIKDRIQTGASKIDPFESLQIHFSLGMIQTVNSLLVADRSISRLEDGVMLGLGIDLFTPEWVAEGLLKNYGRSTQNDSSLALREFDLRLSYLQQAPQNKMKFRLSNGLGARYLRYTNKWSGFSLLQTTPVYLLGFGLLIPMGSHFDLGVEVQGHLSLINETIDRHGLSLLLRLDNFF